MSTNGYAQGGGAGSRTAGRSNGINTEMDTSASKRSLGSGSSSKRRTVKKAADLKEYHLPTSASLKQFAIKREPESAISRLAYADPLVPAQRIVSKAHSPHITGTYTRTTSAAIGRGQLVTVQQAFATRKVVPVSAVPRLAAAAASRTVDGEGQPKCQLPPSAPLPAGPHQGDSDTRFRAFLARVGRGKDPPVPRHDRGIQGSAVPPTISTSYKASEYAPSIAGCSLDDLDVSLDPDFLAEITRTHGLEADSRDFSSSFANEDAVETPSPTPATPELAAGTSSFLSPETSGFVTSTRAKPPPRPPRSMRRLSASPVAASGADQQARAGRSRQQTLPAYQDADEESGHVLPLHDPAPASHTTSRRTSVCSTRRSYSRRASLDPGLQPDAAQTASPPIARSSAADVSHNVTATFEDIVPDLPDPIQEDYERDRRLSSLLKGLGIQGLSSRPPSPVTSEPTQYYPPVSSAREEEEEESPTHALGEPAEIASPEVTLDFTMSEASHVEDRGGLDSGRLNEQDDWGSAYPDSPERQSKETASSLSSTYHTAAEWMEDNSATAPRISSARRQRSASVSSQKRSRLRSNSQTGHRNRSTSFLDAGSPSRTSKILSNDARASLGITDSVLASILASDSFYLPNGARLSVNELAARLSMDQHQLRRSLTSHLAIPPPDSPAPGSTAMTASTSSRRSSMQYFGGRPLSTNGSRTSWMPETPATQYFDDSPRIAGAGTGYMDAKRQLGAQLAQHEDPTEEQQPAAYLEPDKADPYHRYDDSHAYAGAAGAMPDPHSPPRQAWQDEPPVQIPDISSPQRPVDYSVKDVQQATHSQPVVPPTTHSVNLAPVSAPQAVTSENRRKRTLSVNAFQKLANSFSGTSRSGKSRKRLPSFFGGSTPSLERGIESLPNKPVSSDSVSLAPSSIRAPSPTPSSAPAIAREAPPANPASTGSGRARMKSRPLSLHEIAQAITGSPSLPPAPPDVGPSRFVVHRPVAAHPMGQLPMASDRTWRATIPDSIYDQIRRIHSADELLRQEVIFELCQTEESFVNGLKGVVRLFSQPLRTPHGKWIAGVPFNVSRLFDSLNDIVYLHSHLVDALRQNKLAQGALVLRFADTFQPYVSRLEVHQAYLVRFEGVTREIEDLARKPDSEFGEFVRMQQGLPECGAMTLSSFLLKPVQRLMKYPLFFKQLCDLTPQKHPDYYLSKELLESTDAIIRVMEEAKAREDEYEEMRAQANLGKMSSVNSRMALAKMGIRRPR